MFLSIESSSGNVSLAISKGGKVIVDHNRRLRFGASTIVPRLAGYLKKRKINLKSVKAFILGAGPGSFTGLRISYAVIKAFNVALNKPVVTVGSFCAMAEPFLGRHKRIVVLADARKHMVYYARFIDGRLRGREKLGVLSELVKDDRDSFFITYDAAVRAQVLALYPQAQFYAKDVYPTAKNLLRQGIKLYNEGKFTPLDKLEPLYLHPKDCQVRK